MPFLARTSICVLLLASPAVVLAQDHDGHRGVGHAQLHAEFYSKLMRKDTKTSCCNMVDCRPTQSRMTRDHYEVMVDGEWTTVPPVAIQNVPSPDGEAHVCAPAQRGVNKGVIYCVVLPPET